MGFETSKKYDVYAILLRKSGAETRTTVSEALFFL